MNPAWWAIVTLIGLVVGIVAYLEIGYRIGVHSVEKYPESSHEGIGVIEAAVFALLGLLLVFSFARGTSRLVTKRQLALQEANAIGTAYLRVDELPVSEQPELHRLFREYLDTRLRVYDRLPDLKAAEPEIARTVEIQDKIWSCAVSASRNDPTQNVASLLLPALNEMIEHRPRAASRCTLNHLC
jgi:hypothetical protein